MKPISRSEVLALGAYEEIREPFRRRVIDLKALRRVPLGSNITALFENRDTVLYQIQEMLRTERITREDAVVHEIETYNELLPGQHELSATLFLEYPEREERERMLVALDGIGERFYLEVGAGRAGVRNETRGVVPGRTTAVHYAKFVLGAEVAAELALARASVTIGVDHPAYSARTALPPRTVEELAHDLAGDRAG